MIQHEARSVMLLETPRVPVESQRIDGTYKLSTLYQKDFSKYVDSYFRALKTVRLMARVSEVYMPHPKRNMVDPETRVFLYKAYQLRPGRDCTSSRVHTAQKMQFQIGIISRSFRAPEIARSDMTWHDLERL